MFNFKQIQGSKSSFETSGLKILALGVRLSVFLYHDVKTAVVLQVLQSRFVNIVEVSKSDQPSMCKGVAQNRHTVTPPKSEPLEIEKSGQFIRCLSVGVSFSGSIFVLGGVYRDIPKNHKSSAHSSYKTPLRDYFGSSLPK